MALYHNYGPFFIDLKNKWGRNPYKVILDFEKYCDPKFVPPKELEN
jgi:hypothetical protein